MNWTVSYYNERVKRNVFALPPGILADYLRLLDLMQEFGANLCMPHSRAMGDGLFELRLKGREGIGRVLYCTHVGQQVVVLHSFVKKTQETPNHELRRARARLKEIRND
jgi:phage-related protein